MPMLSVRVSDDLDLWLEGRAASRMQPASPAQRARTELELWREHLAAELRRLPLTLPEANVVGSLMQGVVLDDAVGLSVAMAVMELRTMQPQAADEWGVNLADLADRLVAAGPTANHALVHAAARWWQNYAPATADGWRSVGVRIV